MLSNPGKTLRTYAVILCIAMLVGTFILANDMAHGNDAMIWTILLAGVAISITSAILLDAFGSLVENTQATREKLDRLQWDLMSRDLMKQEQVAEKQDQNTTGF